MDVIVVWGWIVVGVEEVMQRHPNGDHQAQEVWWTPRGVLVRVDWCLLWH